MSRHIARKRFGQNFLHDQAVIERIVAAIDPQPGQHLIEIGPGQGALTQPLLDSAARIDAIEIDRDLISRLRDQFNQHDLFRLYNADALKFDFCELAEAGQPLRIVGNLPYNISTPLLFHLLKQLGCIVDMHFMLQREVAERLAAAPGSKAYGRLSIMVQYYCTVDCLFIVGPGSFQPVPKVDSAIVRLAPYRVKPVIADDDVILSQVVTQAFSQRRKTLRNTLKDLVSSDEMAKAMIDPQLRAESLTIAEFVTLANIISARKEPSR